MSFGESIFSTGFIQKTVKVDLHVGINRAYPPRHKHQNTLKDSRGLHIEVEPHLQAGQPMGPIVSVRITMLVLYRLLGCIYAIL